MTRSAMACSLISISLLLERKETKTMSLSMSKAIAQCPKSMFGKKGERPPNYPGIFAAVAKALLTEAGVKFSTATVDAVAEVINPSTLQRQIAQRREALTGKWNADKGTYEDIPEKAPKAKVAPRGVDPISGEKKARKAAKGKVAAPKKSTEGTGAKLKKGITKPTPKKAAKAASKVHTVSKKAAKAPAAPTATKPVKSAAKSGKVLTELSALAKARAALAAKSGKAMALAPAAAAEPDDDDVI